MCPRRSAYQPGIDTAKLNQLGDELEMEADGEVCPGRPAGLEAATAAR